ncbi:MAG: GNAT family N-acetyltransferase [Anaerolineae bacterium]|nr:GNAT family N-acetyltransferase [Anaerolineae bacterium]
MNIRPAQISDATAIAEVHVASWQTAYRGILPDKMLDNLSVETRAKNWRAWLDESRGQTIVVEVEGQVVGFVMFGRTRDKDVDLNAVGEIYAIYLHPDVWRQGYGRSLVNAVKSALQRDGFSELLLWVLAENESAIHFYKKVGFHADGATKVEFEPDGTELFERRYRQPITFTV